MDTVGESQNLPFKTKCTDLTSTQKAIGHKTKSVSCIVIMMGTHCLRTRVATKMALALSSGEAEFVAQVKGASVGIGMQSVVRDMGRKDSMRLHIDSTASEGIANRVGVGNIRHVDTGLLWIQFRRVAGSKKKADIEMKDVNAETLTKLMNAVESDELRRNSLKTSTSTKGCSRSRL